MTVVNISTFTLDCIVSNLTDKQCTMLNATDYMLSNFSSVRRTADVFGVPKTSLHRFFRKELESLSNEGYSKVSTLLEANWKDRNNRERFPVKENR